MFEQAFKNIDDILWKEAGCTTELDYTEQTVSRFTPDEHTAKVCFSDFENVACRSRRGEDVMNMRNRLKKVKKGFGPVS